MAVVRNFTVGKKELFLPNVTICLLRTSFLGPNFAKFQVPLHFSKLDIRDYLYHVYNVGILSVRSYVKQQRVQAGKSSDTRPVARRWHRPRARKFMTVELQRPFRWPEEPENYDEWNMKEVKAAEEEQTKMQEREQGTLKDAVPNDERRERMREQAKELLEGKVKWKAPVRGPNGITISRT